MNLLNKLTIKNLKLNKKRTIVTIIGVILSVALITAVATLFFSANASLIKYEISKKGNFHYVFRNVEEKNIKYFKENRDVENYYVTQEVGYASLEDCQNENKPYACIEAFDKKSFDNLGINLVEGRIPESNKEIVIPTHLKTNGRISYKVGDKITLKVGKRTSDGYELGQNNPYSEENEEKLEETKEITYEIVGIIERPNTTIEPYTAPGYTFITYLDDYDKNKDLDIYVRYYKKILKEDFKVTADILDVDETLLKNYIPNYLYLSMTSSITHLEEPFSYEINYVSTKINKLTDEQTSSFLNTIKNVTQLDFASEIYTSLSTTLINLMIGNENYEDGFTYSLSKNTLSGVKDYTFKEENGNRYYVIKRGLI